MSLGRLIAYLGFTSLLGFNANLGQQNYLKAFENHLTCRQV